MANHESRIKRAPAKSWLYLRCNITVGSQLAGERHILELIALGTPLRGILNRLCTAIDVQIGNVVSLVLLTGERENDVCPVGHSALQMNLNVFSSTAIVSRDRTLLGTLEIYGCDPRRPTSYENQLIERVVCLAAIALQRHADEQEFKKPSAHKSGELGGALEKPPSIH